MQIWFLQSHREAAAKDAQYQQYPHEESRFPFFLFTEIRFIEILRNKIQQKMKKLNFINKSVTFWCLPVPRIYSLGV